MLETTLLFLILLAVFLVGGIVLGWIFRSNQVAGEKSTINAGWQEQLTAQRSEHKRLINQNRSLMQQVNQFQTSLRDAEGRARQSETLLNEATAAEVALRQQLDEVTRKLDAATNQRERLQSDIDTRIAQDSAAGATIRERDEKIFRLSRELESWQNRLPPLIEKYREQHEAAELLQVELDAARKRIEELEDTGPRRGTGNVSRIDGDDRLTDSGDEFEDAHDGTDAAPQPPLFAYDENDLSSASLIEEIEASIRHPVGEFSENADAHTDAPGSVPEEQPVTKPGGLRDDLQRIRGIGPAIEKTLNEMGIFRFNQIAEMSEYDIDRVANRLRGFHSRIYREDWIGQARVLNDRKTGTRY